LATVAASGDGIVAAAHTPVRRTASAWIGALALVVGAAAAVILNVSQVLIATQGNPTGVRVVIGAVVAITAILLVAYYRLREPAFTILAGGTMLFLIAAGLISLSAAPK
jgi:hypothetical protein